MTKDYPLSWPEGWARTESRKNATFKVTQQQATWDLEDELKRLGAKNPVITSNQRRPSDGKPKDPGVALYFDLESKEQCIPCDKWSTVGDNIRAIGLTIAALRGLERWGAKDMVNAAFRGFAALPAPSGSPTIADESWHEVLRVLPDATVEEIKAAYRVKVRAVHPDAGGSPEQMRRVQRAYEQAMREREVMS